MRHPGTIVRTPARPGGPASEAAAPESPGVDRSPRALAQRRRIDEVFGDAAAGPPVQRVLNIDGEAVAPERITRKGAFKTRLNAVISDEAAAAAQAPQAVRAQLVAAARDAAVHDFDTQREAVRWAAQERGWAGLPARPEILYRTAPLTEAAARAVLHGIETADPTALQGLQHQGQVFPVPGPDRARGQEWGILKARSRADECVIVIGDDTGVSWAPELLGCGLAIAHAHPYFERGKVRNRYGGISLATKEIADHGDLPPGMIAWDDLAGRTTGGAASEVSKIFPSASDLHFSAKQRLPRHTVYTPYAVVRNKANRAYVANPELDNGRFRQAPRLSFWIDQARMAGDGVNATARLQALEGAHPIWSQQVTTDGVGPFGLLAW